MTHLRLVEDMTSKEVASILATPSDRFSLLLLLEKDPPKPKPGVPSLSQVVMGKMIPPLEEVLTKFCAERPRVGYHKLLLNRSDTKSLTALGVCWLPQIRLMRGKKTLVRSSISLGDTGQFLAQDVGGRSFIRRFESSTGFYNLVDVLASETDRKRLT